MQCSARSKRPADKQHNHTAVSQVMAAIYSRDQGVVGESDRDGHALLDPAACADMFSEPHNFATLRRTLRQADEPWMEEFVECDGLLALFDALSTVVGLNEMEFGSVDNLLGSLPQLECIECLKAVMNSSYGMEAVINSGSDKFVNRLVLELDSHNIMVNMHLFLLLSALCKHSEEGFAATLLALDNYKREKCTRHRYSILIFELQASDDFPEHQAAVMAFINYIVSACDNLDERMKLRSELSALQLPDKLAVLRLSDEECLSEQVRLYEEGQIKDQAEVAMPGGVDVSNHEHLFRALFEKVFGTPQASCLLHILQNLLMIERDSPKGDAVWNSLERFVDSSISMTTPQQLDRVYTAGVERLRRALEEEEQRKSEGGEIVPDSGEVPVSGQHQQCEEVASTVERQQSRSLPNGHPEEQQHVAGQPPPPPAAPSAPPPPPPPGAPPPPPPAPTGLSLGRKIVNTVAAVLSIFDRARQYRPKKRMKKLNWEKVPTHDAMTDGALWYDASKLSATLKVKVREEDLESLFSQKNFGKQASNKSQKTHLPNQKKALNVNIVLDAMKRPNKEAVAMVRNGDFSSISLTQASILVDQTPDDADVGFLMQFVEDPSPLGKTEDFLLHLVQLECYPQRLRLLKFKIIVEDVLEEYQPSFEILHKAMDELVQCSPLQELFKIILLIGNIINGGSKLGEAYGFKLTSLQRLSGTLANVNRPNVNILHYLVTVCEEDCPNLLQFSQELPTLDSASRISVTALEEEFSKLRKRVDTYKKELRTGKALEKEEEDYKSDEEKVYVDLPEDMLEQIQAFIPVAEDKLSAVTSGLEDVRSGGRMMAQYFCDDRTDFLDQVFVEIKTFRDEFRKIMKETFKERPIQLHLVASPKPNQEDKKSQRGQTPTSEKQLSRPGFNRAVSVVTEQEVGYTVKQPSPCPSPYQVTEAPHIATYELSHSFGEDQLRHGMQSRRVDAAARLPSPVDYSRTVSMDYLGPSAHTYTRRVSWSQDQRKTQSLKRGRLNKMVSMDCNHVLDSNLNDVARILHKMAQAIRNDMQDDH